MALGNLFSLAKLTVTAYTDVARTRPHGAPFEVQFNPETLTASHGSELAGMRDGRAVFTWRHNQVLKLTLLFDGTNVDSFGVERLFGETTVATRVREFLERCHHRVDTSHEPAFLVLTWDKGLFRPSFECRLQHADIAYTSFDRDGAPLRATISATFVEDVDPKKQAQRERLSSPDLTHRRVVRAGDTLPLLCREIYGSAEHVVRVAEVNGLDGLRELTPGQELYFPPYARPGS